MKTFYEEILEVTSREDFKLSFLQWISETEEGAYDEMEIEEMYKEVNKHNNNIQNSKRRKRKIQRKRND